MLPDYFFVLDVESTALHGVPFAMGWVVVDTKTRVEIAHRYMSCLPVQVPDTWVVENVIPVLPPHTHLSFKALVMDFATEWVQWRANGAWLATDVAWPVEAKFLLQAVEIDRRIVPVYPLIDIASVRLAKGLDPCASYARESNELPAHHPVADARQSARLLLEVL